MKILVTGGAGFIGGNFVHYMVNKYPEDMIVNLDLLTYAGNLETCKPVEGKPNYKFVKGDIADREFIFDLFKKEKFDVVVNFAAESHVDRSIEDPEIFVKTNVMGTTTLLDACNEFGIKRYHQVSTDEVYGDLPLDRPDLFFTEETPLHTSSPYSSSKASADLFVLAYHRTFGLPVTISRCSNNYGPYHFPEKLIPLIISRALNDEELPVCSGYLRNPWQDHDHIHGYGDFTGGRRRPDDFRRRYLKFHWRKHPGRRFGAFRDRSLRVYQQLFILLPEPGSDLEY